MVLFRNVKFNPPKIRLPSCKITSETIQELAILAGFLMLLKGLWMIYPPLMWIAGGLWLMYPAQSRAQRR